MQLVSSLAIVAVMVAAVAVATPPIIDTPVGATQCSPTELLWDGGAEVSVESSQMSPQNPDSVKSIVNESRQILETFAGLTGHSFIWSTNIPGGEIVGVQLRDSTGTEAETALFEIVTSSDSSCL
ncbi:hypothetical protein K466DRAFT_600043 [Polyporus arcularius HHB13444]|uniref:Uncharacterized protein n=1 Tax=Polyporus arcularius HHB13444 TaxID=1314778 RepID=A0A5C3PEV5_9APHY|nr:hypothetical protein K466DRAFT_600043 [Polyporus arcularius HHB13444]